MVTAMSPNRRYSGMAAASGSSCSDRNWARRRTPICWRKASLMSRARLGEMPLISVSLSGSFSMTSSASAPKRWMMRRAVPARMPLIAPEARYS